RSGPVKPFQKVSGAASAATGMAVAMASSDAAAALLQNLMWSSSAIVATAMFLRCPAGRLDPVLPRLLIRLVIFLADAIDILTMRAIAPTDAPWGSTYDWPETHADDAGCGPHGRRFAGDGVAGAEQRGGCPGLRPDAA